MGFGVVFTQLEIEVDLNDIKGTGFSKNTHSLTNIKEFVDDLETRLSAIRAGYLVNINNANLATIADISSLTATKIGYLDELAAANIPSDVDDIKAKTDNLPAANADVSGSITWVTATHTTNEGDISALFSTDLTGTTRRRYAVFVDLTGCEADAAAWTTCTVRVKIGFGVGDAYRTVDLKEIAKTDVAAAAEPGVPIDVPATAKNVQITLQFDVALAADATIYYSYVREALE